MNNQELSHPDPDFSLAGTSLLEWLGQLPHDAVIKAAENAIDCPGEPFIVGIFVEPSLPAHNFGAHQRHTIRVWARKSYPDLKGRLRVSVQTRLHPQTSQDVKVAVVIYDEKARTKKAATNG